MRFKIKNKAGFTLVELIVVLVILAILATFLIPALTGYINKAKERTAIAECRYVVQAAQTIAVECYSKDGYCEEATLVSNDNKKRILTLAQVKSGGEILDINCDNIAKIIKLKYKASNGIIVLYENGKYTISSKESFNRQVENYINQSTELLLLSKDGNKLRINFKDKNGGEFPSLSKREKDILKKYTVENDQYRLSAKDVDELVWKPTIIKKGNENVIMMVATKKDIDNSACMLYYEGKYYYHGHKTGNALSSVWVPAYRNNTFEEVINIGEENGYWNEIENY